MSSGRVKKSSSWSSRRSFKEKPATNEEWDSRDESSRPRNDKNGCNLKFD